MIEKSLESFISWTMGESYNQIKIMPKKNSRAKPKLAQKSTQNMLKPASSRKEKAEKKSKPASSRKREPGLR